MMILTLQIQKEIKNQQGRDKIVRQLEKDGWCVNVQDESSEEDYSDDCDEEELSLEAEIDRWNKQPNK